MRYWVKVNFNLCWAKLSSADSTSGPKETLPQQPGHGIAQGAINPTFPNLPIPESRNAAPSQLCCVAKSSGTGFISLFPYLQLPLSPEKPQMAQQGRVSPGSSDPPKAALGQGWLTPGWGCAASPGSAGIWESLLCSP